MRARTAIQASRDLLSTQHALSTLDQAQREMCATYAGHVPADMQLEFQGEYVQWLTHRWFAEQWLRQQAAANDHTVSPAGGDRIAVASFTPGPDLAGGLFTPAAARHPHADDTHRPPAPTEPQRRESTER